MKENRIVGEVEITTVYVIQHSFGVLVSYLSEGWPGHIDFYVRVRVRSQVYDCRLRISSLFLNCLSFDKLLFTS